MKKFLIEGRSNGMFFDGWLETTGAHREGREWRHEEDNKQQFNITTRSLYWLEIIFYECFKLFAFPITEQNDRQPITESVASHFFIPLKNETTFLSVVAAAPPPLVWGRIYLHLQISNWRRMKCWQKRGAQVYLKVLVVVVVERETKLSW